MTPKNAKRVLKVIGWFCNVCHFVFPWKRWSDQEASAKEREGLWAGFVFLNLIPAAALAAFWYWGNLRSFWSFAPSAFWSTMAIWSALDKAIRTKVEQLEQIAKMPEGALQDESKKGAVSLTQKA